MRTQMVKLVYGKLENYEHAGCKGEAIEYAEAVKSDREEDSIILR